MEILTNRNVLYIFRRAMNKIDYRMVDHAQRVAYLMMRMLRVHGGYTREQMAEICVMALWHDIGAYKTEEISSMTAVNEMVRFEVQDVLPHSVYGYLFFQELMDRGHISDTLLYHHIPYECLQRSGCENKDLAAMLFVADRYDLLMQMQKKVSVRSSLAAYKGTIFGPQAVDLMSEVDRDGTLAERLELGDCIEELFDAFAEMEFSSERLVDFLWLLAYSIDFRSPYTVAHTINTASISQELADLMGVCCDDKEALYLGSIVHDLGKISTPVEILEKPGKLTPAEFKIMQRHVTETEKILDGCVNQEIIDIAVRHHEKLDGSGYPRGLDRADLTLCQRILAVADVTSALVGKRSYKEAMPPEQVQGILSSDAQRGKLCPQVVNRLVEHYSAVLARADEKAAVPLEKYRQIVEQYPMYMEQMVRLCRSCD